MKTSPICRTAFPAVLTSTQAIGGTDRYWQVTIMLDKSNPEHMAWLKETAAEYNQCLMNFYPDAAKRPRIPFTGHDKSPCKDGDTATNQQGIPLREKNPEYAGHYLLRYSAKDDGKPRRHFVLGSKMVNGAWVEISSQTEIYGGCWGRVAGNFYQRKVASNPGVSVGLQGFQKVKDDESFGTPRIDPNDAFGALPGMNDPANYEPDPFGTGTPPQTNSLFGDDIPF
jgi:hypothetical protein